MSLTVNHRNESEQSRSAPAATIQRGGTLSEESKGKS